MSLAEMKTYSSDPKSRSDIEDRLKIEEGCPFCPLRDLALCIATATDIAATLHAPVPVVREVPARRIISRPQDTNDLMPVICSGWSASSVVLQDGRRQILSFHLPGDLVSTASIFAPSQFLVETVSATRYRLFNRVKLKAAIFENLAALSRFAQAWVQEKGWADELAVDLGRRSADARVARLILRLMDRLAQKSMAHEGTIPFPVRQHQIADATGLTPVHVNKVLAGFRRQGLVVMRERTLKVLDFAGLRRTAAVG
jgi:CRP/FNR family transcriptional regulator, anaerobic regulatory protein